MKQKVLLLLSVFAIAPLMSQAQVLISEVAWMGTEESSGNEWFELYNFSTEPTDLSGWSLTLDGGFTFPLSGVLSPHGVGLFERGSDASVPGTSALDIFTDELPDSGGTLTLKDSSDTTSDIAEGGTNWADIGGTSLPPIKTAQRTRMGEWVTAAPTPGGENAQVNDPIVLGASTTTSTESGSGGGGGSSHGRKNGLVLTMSASSTVYVGKPASFTLLPGGVSKTKLRTLTYYWNFGDMTTGEEQSLSHTFEFPGTYMVVGEASSTRSVVKVEQEIKVLPSPVSLRETEKGDVELVNETGAVFALDGFTLAGEEYSFTFPRYSSLTNNGVITLAHVRISDEKALTLTDTSGDTVATLTLEK